MIVENCLKECREEKGVSREAVADAVNVTTKTIYRYETGNQMPKLDSALRLSAYYGKTVNALFKLKDD